MAQARKATASNKGQFYPVILETQETGGFFVVCPSFEGCFTQGKTAEDALKNIREAIELCAMEARPRRLADVSVHMVRV